MGCTMKLVLVMVLMVIGALLSPCYASVDDMPFKGTPLQDQEMDEVRGGFTLPNGNFLYLSMDVMRVKIISQSDPVTPGSKSGPAGYVNMLNQQALITDKGISFNMQVIQAGSEKGGSQSGNAPAAQSPAGAAAANTPAAPGPATGPAVNTPVSVTSPAVSTGGNPLAVQPAASTTTGMATLNLFESRGIVNANLNTGTGNVTQSIANIININIGIFNLGNSSQALPVLQNWLRF